MEETQTLSFELDEDMLEMIAERCSGKRIVSRFAKAIEGRDQDKILATGEQFFSEYGTAWGQEVVSLGETHMDRTYEILKESLDQTGNPRFPLVPQRFIEIAYLGTQEISTLILIENNYRRIIYRIEDCTTYREISSQCGLEAAGLFACQHGCLSMCQAVMKSLGIKGVSTNLTAGTPENGHCEFLIDRSS